MMHGQKNIKLLLTESVL